MASKIEATIAVHVKDEDGPDELLVYVHVEDGKATSVVDVRWVGRSGRRGRSTGGVYPFTVDELAVCRKAEEVFATCGLTSVRCPACGVNLSVDVNDDDKIECGGIGEGICNDSCEENVLSPALAVRLRVAYDAAVAEAHR